MTENRTAAKNSEIVQNIAPVLRSLLGESSLGRQRFFLDKPEMCSGEIQKINIPTSEITSGEDITALLKNQLADKSFSAVEIDSLGWFIKTADPNKRKGRLKGKVALITGAAQGFGEGIAYLLAAEGAYIVIADIKQNLADKVAMAINNDYGADTAQAIYCDVSDEESVRQLIYKSVLGFGGIDVLVSNAGVLRAGGLEDMTLQDFEFVTKINYIAFFLLSKYAARPMRLQAGTDEKYAADIIQINSKSGLEGSNRNFAYAGSKFGGIGLVQSFARELIADNIKVNAICPGNFYAGPLWSDPDKGLFIQYLQSGKVPGAKTAEDVRRFYVDKVPMRRGCMPEDVARAIFYCVEQQYETGQAIPVTGGQIMLN